MQPLAEPRYTVPYVGRRLPLETTLPKVFISRYSALYVFRGAGVYPPKYPNVLTYRRL
jgi:hypothetical protein